MSPAFYFFELITSIIINNGREQLTEKNTCYQNFSQSKRPSMQKQGDLIRFVINEGKSILKAAKKLKIKYSRAKRIVKHFKETGTIICNP